MEVGASTAAAAGWRSHYISGAPERNVLADLTAQDRAFIKATTGTEITDDTVLAPDIAFELASERRMGLVEGAVGREWLAHLSAKYADSAPTERPFTNAWIAAAMKYLEVPGSDSVDSLLEVTA
ncbi:hypothetical protein [Actinotalea subterranea]|uniref:hypothetical protein n=1 Tax=Actinotalea subterranea TaxID=2607497 RepID=UPI0011ED2158|nr:hypothetical protein [Actinotalea subterranea]